MPLGRWLYGPATKSSMTSRFRFVKGFRKNLLDCFRPPRSRQALLPATRDSMTWAAAGVKGFKNLFQIFFGLLLPAEEEGASAIYWAFTLSTCLSICRQIKG